MLPRDRLLLRRHALTALVGLVLGLLAGAVHARSSPEVYESRTQLFVSAPQAANAGSVNERALFAQQRVKSYLPLVESPLVLSPVIARLQLDTTPELLADRIGADSPPDTVLVSLTAQASSALQAQQLADIVAEELTSVVTSLEGGQNAGASTVTLSVVTPAQFNPSPVSPRLLRDLLLGGVLGLGLGIAVAAARERLDPRITSGDQVQQVTGAPVLSELPRERKRLATSRPPHLKEYRELLLRLSVADEHGFVLVVSSAVRGEGSTATVQHLAAALVASGRSVLVVDGDRRSAALTQQTGLRAGPGLQEVLDRRSALANALVRTGPAASMLGATAASDGGSPMAAERLRDVLSEARTLADLVLVDGPPLLESDNALALADAADGVLLVVRLGGPTPEQVRQAAARLHAAGAVLLGSVLQGSLARPRRGPDAPVSSSAPASTDAPVMRPRLTGFSTSSLARDA